MDSISSTGPAQVLAGSGVEAVEDPTEVVPAHLACESQGGAPSPDPTAGGLAMPSEVLAVTQGYGVAEIVSHAIGTDLVNPHHRP